jgi:UTP--glucose-1-phosphate uridylyltransferase
MKKSEACKLLGGNQTKLGKILGRGKSAISQWPDELTEDQTNLVIGAAIRRGIKIPKEFLS